MNQGSDQRQKVLYIITKATWGGAQRYVYDLASSLPRDRFNTIVAYGETGLLSEKLRHTDIRAIQVPHMQRDIETHADISTLASLTRLIRKEKPSVVHVNSSKAALLGALAARICRVPYIVFTVHGWPFKERLSLIRRAVYYAASWCTALCAHTIIVVSMEDARIGTFMPFVSRKVRYVPLGITPIPYLPKEDALRALWNIVPQDKAPREAVKIVTIAELTPNKGVRFGIEAVRELLADSPEHYMYFIIGDGEERAALEYLVRENMLERTVFFLGFIPDAAKIIRAFDVFLLPSVKEGMPYVILEAGESGVPVVTTDVVDRELVRQYPFMRTVRAGNAPEIAEAIRRTSVPSAQPHSETPRFPLSAMTRKTIEIYEAFKQRS